MGDQKVDSNLPRILIVDDELGRDVQMLLESLPAQVDIVRDGDGAFDALMDVEHHRRPPYNLLVLDMALPDDSLQTADAFSKWALTFLLQQQRAYKMLPPDTPIIVYTQYPSYEDCVSCIKAGATDYIPKIDPELENSNSERLFNACRRLIRPTPDPDELWVQLHFKELEVSYSGKVVGIFDITDVRGTNIPLETAGGKAILVGDSFDDLRNRVINNKRLRRSRPFIVRIPGRKD
jgi:CheY-like chemotaxis protein